MGVCASKDRDDGGRRVKTRSNEGQQSSRSIVDNPRGDIRKNKEAMQRFKTIDTTEELEIGGLKIRYGFMSQRGYYPGGEYFILHCITDHLLFHCSS